MPSSQKNYDDKRRLGQDATLERNVLLGNKKVLTHTLINLQTRIELWTLLFGPPKVEDFSDFW